MRTIERTTAFKRDFRREMRGKHKKTLQVLLADVVQLLADDEPLPVANRDHALTGEWAGFRDCHIKPDLLLIYRLPDAARLQLVRLGSHSELFG
jgi:mRNA interferase YafQ